MSAMFPFCLKSFLQKLYQTVLEDFTNPIPYLYIPSMTILSGDCTTYMRKTWCDRVLSLLLSHWGKKAIIKVEDFTLSAVSRKRGISLFSFFSFYGKKIKKNFFSSVPFRRSITEYVKFWYIDIFIGPKSDHCNHHCIALPCQSLHQSSCWDLIDVTLGLKIHATSPRVTQ